MQDITKGEQYRTKKLQHILKQAHNIMKINLTKANNELYQDKKRLKTVLAYHAKISPLIQTGNMNLISMKMFPRKI